MTIVGNNKPNAYGAFCMVLHSHIPFCRKSGVWPFGEEWVFEGITETYLPLLNIMYELKEKKIPPKFTISFSPVLMEQLSDEYMLKRYEEYINERIEIAKRDIYRFSSTEKNGALLFLSEYYKNNFINLRSDFYNKYEGNILKHFAELQDAGLIEIITTAATHPYLPLLSRDSSIYSQIKLGIETYKKHFHCPPKGFWLPECGYRPQYFKNVTANESYYKPAIDEFLVKEGIKYTIVDSYAVEGEESFWGGKCDNLYNYALSGEERSKSFSINNSSYLPYMLPSGCMVVARNKVAGLQVWSSEYGYSCDGNYRDFYKRDPSSGLQYWKITDKSLPELFKEVYQPENTKTRVDENAYHFNILVENLLKEFRKSNNEYGLVLTAFDTELFGHWWYEGIEWLKLVVEKMFLNPFLHQLTVSEFLAHKTPTKKIELPESSWGPGNDSHLWYNKDTEWMFRHIEKCELLLEDLLARYNFAKPGDELYAALAQLARELLLLEASDWQFLIATKSGTEYATQRFITHYQRFIRLYEGIVNNEYTTQEFKYYLLEVQSIDNLFPDIEPYIFTRREPQPF